MGRRFVCLLLVLGGFLAIVPDAAAYNQRIIVYAVVPPLRAIYLNDSGTVIKVVGNTSDNIEPAVYNSQNLVVQMNESIKNQYDRFMASQAWHLKAGQAYEVNPIYVNTDMNNQTITIDSELRLGFY
jgi:hypothetical protein